MPWSPPGSPPTGTGRSSACRSPAPRTAPAGWPTSAHLTARGLTGARLVTSDAHRGLVAAIGAPLPGAAWAALPHPLRGQPDGGLPEEQLAVGAGTAALGLRPA